MSGKGKAQATFNKILFCDSLKGSHVLLSYGLDGPGPAGSDVFPICSLTSKPEKYIVSLGIFLGGRWQWSLSKLASYNQCVNAVNLNL